MLSKIYEPNAGIFSFQLSFDTDKFFNKIPIIAPKFEKEILTDLDLLKNIDEVRGNKITKQSLDSLKFYF